MATDQSIRRRLERLEVEARTRPWLHAARLRALALVGYLYPVAILLLTIVLGMVLLMMLPSVMRNGIDQSVIAFAIVLVGSLILTGAVIKSFLIRLPDPTGMEVTAADAPALWAIVEESRRAVGVPRIHHLLIDEQRNAAAVQRRRWAIFGPRVNYVILGLPLMMFMSPAELQCVITHEMAHLRGRHSTLAARIFRLNQTWQALAAPLARTGWLRRVAIGWFANWYGRHIAVTTLAIRRLYEYEADRRSAAGLADPANAGRALIALNWSSYRMDRTFWPDLSRRIPDEPVPPAELLSVVRDFLASPSEPGQAARWRAREKRCRTPISWDHPCLRDRLESLGQLALLDAATENGEPPTAPDSAGSIELFGDLRDRACKTINAMWKASIIHGWRSHYQSARAAQEAQATIAPADLAAEPDLDRRARREWESRQPEIDRASTEQALEIMREFISRYPKLGVAHYALGRLLLRQDDESAVTHLEAAMACDSEMIGQSLHLLLDYYRNAGRDDDADPIRVRLETYERDLVRARRERLVIRRGDRFDPHGLPAADLEKLRRVLYRFPSVQTAWLARKRVRLFSDTPIYALAVDRRAGLLDDRRRFDKWLVAALAAQATLPCAAVVLPRASRGLRRRLLAACPQPVFVAAEYHLRPGR